MNHQHICLICESSVEMTSEYGKGKCVKCGAVYSHDEGIQIDPTTVAELREQRNDLNRKLDAEMQTAAGLRERIEQMTSQISRLNSVNSVITGVNDQLLCERDCAIAERDRLLSRCRTIAQTIINGIGSVGPEDAEQAVERLIAERESLSARTKELESDAYAVAHAIVADEVRKLREQVKELEVKIQDSADMYFSADRERSILLAQIANATSPEGIQRAVNTFNDGQYVLAPSLSNAIKAALQVKP